MHLLVSRDTDFANQVKGMQKKQKKRTTAPESGGSLLGRVLIFALSAGSIAIAAFIFFGQNSAENFERIANILDDFRTTQINLRRGDPNSIAHMNDVLDQMEKAGNPQLALGSRDWFAMYCRTNSLTEESARQYQLELKFAEKLHLDGWIAQAEHALAYRNILSGEITENDIVSLNKALQIYKSESNPTRAMSVLSSISEANSLLGKTKDAEAALDEIDHIAAKSGLAKPIEYEFCRALAYLGSGNYPKIAPSIIKFFHEQGNTPDYLREFANLGASIDVDKLTCLKKHAQWLTFFGEGKFAELERFAADFRRSKQIFADGTSPLSDFYSTFIPPSSESEANIEKWARIAKVWVKRSPSSAVASEVLANCLSTYAWKARGDGWASSVSDSAQNVFAQRLLDAQAALDECKAKEKNIDGNWYTASQQVALGRGWNHDSYDALCSEGLHKFPQYYEIYFFKAHYLQPRWYGGPRDFVSFARSAADSQGGEAGDILYARIIWATDRYHLYRNLFTDFPALDWKRARRGFEALLRKYPKSVVLNCAYLQLGLAAGDESVAKSVFNFAK